MKYRLNDIVIHTSSGSRGVAIGVTERHVTVRWDNGGRNRYTHWDNDVRKESMNTKKTIHIISGGTISHVATHLGLCAPAYGKVGESLANLCHHMMENLETVLHQTKMVMGSRRADSGTWYDGKLETNEDVARLIQSITDDLSSKIVFMPVALCDFEVSEITHWGAPDPNGMVYDNEKNQRVAFGGSIVPQKPGKGSPRLSTHGDGHYTLRLKPADKIIKNVRAKRKDIFLVGFKTTDNASEDEMYLAGLRLLKESSCNLVLANDVKTKVNMVITPEEARYHVTTDRYAALKGLVEMAHLRSHLTFTRSTVVAGEPVPWSDPIVPAALRKVVDFCISKNAYKPFRGATVGHFAAKLSQDTFITSQRKTNFNDLEKIGLVKIKTDGPDTVLAYGAKPSVGGQSQRIVFSEHLEYDCIVHFHCPIKPGSDVPTVSQREYECGSHQCGQNTSNGLKKYWENGHSFSAVFLDQHGPNIVFNSAIDPSIIINFIEENFDLSAKTGGYVTLAPA